MEGVGLAIGSLLAFKLLEEGGLNYVFVGVVLTAILFDPERLSVVNGFLQRTLVHKGVNLLVRVLHAVLRQVRGELRDDFCAVLHLVVLR